MRCPQCGRPGLFRRWFHMVERCPLCNLRFERLDGHWVGALGINTIVTFGALFLVLFPGLLLTAPDIPVVPFIVAGVSIAVLLPLALFPVSRTLWTAIDLLMRPAELDEFEEW